MHNDEYFLKELSHAWKNQAIMNKWMNNFFTYLDRFYVQYNTLPNLTMSGNKIFKTLVYEVLKEDVLKAVLHMIQEVSSVLDVV